MNLKEKKKDIGKVTTWLLLYIAGVSGMLWIFGDSSYVDCLIAASTMGLFITATVTLHVILIERVERVEKVKVKNK
ncbi:MULTISPECIES: hypothetical protein [unclassified Providencia]|uniref:hypothetical protein n=1 Tax=unclassified Providencia TaxID=2633465 RepID=UPI00234B5B96|nr:MULTISPECIES: hypothetical protein [unclassified Providencia]